MNRGSQLAPPLLLFVACSLLPAAPGPPASGDRLNGSFHAVHQSLLFGVVHAGDVPGLPISPIRHLPDRPGNDSAADLNNRVETPYYRSPSGMGLL